MQPTTLPGRPERRVSEYMLDEMDPPRYARVIYVPQESQPGNRIIEAQAYEVDSGGVLLPAPNGMPSRTSSSRHTISMSGVGDTHTLVPGWVRVVGTYDAGNLPEGTQVLESLPETGVEGDKVWCSDKLYRWSVGMVEEILRGKAAELLGILRNSDAMGAFEL